MAIGTRRPYPRFKALRNLRNALREEEECGEGEYGEGEYGEECGVTKPFMVAGIETLEY